MIATALFLYVLFHKTDGYESYESYNLKVSKENPELFFLLEITVTNEHTTDNLGVDEMV